jgi:hypothetical protein
MVAAPEAPMFDFSRATRSALARKGIRVLGLAAVQGDLQAYALDDNGTLRVRTFTEILDLAR